MPAPTFAWRETLAPGSGDPAERYGADLGVTSRYGGVSRAPYAQLNLGGAVGDLPEAVAANRAAVADAVGVATDRLLIPRQCHGAGVEVVADAFADEGPQADALVTTSTSVALAVLVADCVPVLLADRRAGVVAVAHAGRRGLVAGVLEATLRAMRACGADPAHTRAVVGPSICGRCYEVPAALAQEVAATVPLTETVSFAGTPALDLTAGVVGQLRAAGTQVSLVPGCTRERGDLYSYRRDGVTGRFGAVLRLLPPQGTDR